MIYFISDGAGAVKIGFTDRPIEQRLAELQTAATNNLQVIAIIPTGTLLTESQCHRNWKADNVRGEWFRDSPSLRDRILRLAESMDECDDF